MYCSRCGNQLIEGAMFCSNCGMPVDQNVPQPAPQQHQQNVPQPVPQQRQSIQYQQPAQYVHQPQAVPRRSGKGHFWLAVVASFMVVVLIGTSVMYGVGRVIYPKTKGNTESGGVSDSRTGENIPTPNDNYPDDSEVYVGNSNAFKIEPVEGITLSAEENALDRNRTFTMEELSDEILDHCQEYLGDDYFVVTGYTMESGMDESRYFPGTFQIDVDLEKIGISAELADCVELYHLDREGNMYCYLTTVENGHIIAESRENFGFVAVIGSLALVGLVGKFCYDTNTERFEELKGKEVIHYSLKDELSGKAYFEIYYNIEDVEAVAKDKLQTYREEIKNQIVKEFTERIAAMMAADPSLSEAQARKKLDYDGYVKVLKQRLAEDSAYKELQENINNSTAAILKVIEDDLWHAYWYMSEMGYKMPTSKIDVILQSKGELGQANHGRFWTTEYMLINIAPGTFDPENQASRDQLQMTIAHEIFHISQYQYTKSFTNDNLKLLEAMAIRLEIEANPWMKKNGYISETCEITSHDMYNLLGMPVDLHDTEVQTVFMSGEGYTLYTFLDYLDQNASKEVTLKSFLEAMEKKASSKSFAAVVEQAYELNYDSYSEYWRRCWQTHAAEVAESYNRIDWENEFYKKYQFAPMQLRANSKMEAASRVMKNSVNVRRFSYTPEGNANGQYALILNLKDVNMNLLTEFSLYDPENKMKTIDGGYFLPVSSGDRSLIEIHDDRYNNSLDEFTPASVVGERMFGFGASWTFEVFPLMAPEKPKLEQKSQMDDLSVMIPEASEAAQAGFVQGYHVRIECSNGTIREYETTKEDFGKKKTFPLSELIGGNSENKNKESLSFKVTIAEYLRSGESLLLGPESEESTTESEFNIQWFNGTWRYGSKDYMTFQIEVVNDQLIKQYFYDEYGVRYVCERYYTFNAKEHVIEAYGESPAKKENGELTGMGLMGGKWVAQPSENGDSIHAYTYDGMNDNSTLIGDKIWTRE